jgi:hypothetical protein
MPMEIRYSDEGQENSDIKEAKKAHHMLLKF